MIISINIPEELYNQARFIADANQVPVDEVFASALVDQFTALKRLKERAGRGSRDEFLAVLETVPDVPPEEFDRF